MHSASCVNLGLPAKRCYLLFILSLSRCLTITSTGLRCVWPNLLSLFSLPVSSMVLSLPIKTCSHLLYYPSFQLNSCSTCIVFRASFIFMWITYFMWPFPQLANEIAYPLCLFSDAQVLVTLHQAVIPQLSNPILLWWGPMREHLFDSLLIYCILTCYLLTDNMQWFSDKILWYWRCYQCHGSKQPVHSYDTAWSWVS